MNELNQGLALSGIGILITFSALGILILLILLLKFLFPNRNMDPVNKVQSDPDPSREDLLKHAAAAGVAILIKGNQPARRGSLGDLLEKPVGQWWQKGLDRNHNKERL